MISSGVPFKIKRGPSRDFSNCSIQPHWQHIHRKEREWEKSQRSVPLTIRHTNKVPYLTIIFSFLRYCECGVGDYFDFHNIFPQFLQFMIVPHLAYNLPPRLQSTEIPGLWDLGLRQGEPWHYLDCPSTRFWAPVRQVETHDIPLLYFQIPYQCVLEKIYCCVEVLDCPHPPPVRWQVRNLLPRNHLLVTEFIQLHWLFHRE